MAIRGIQSQPLICDQPRCALRPGHMNRPRLADLLIRALSKDEAIDRIPDDARITPRSACIECAKRVILGRSPLLTRSERRKFFLEDPSSSSAPAC